MGWIGSVEHNNWLSAQMRALLEEAKCTMASTGFAHLTTEGDADTTRPVELAVTSRMTYVYSLGVLMGIPGCRRFADHGIHCLSTHFVDEAHGGWFTGLTHDLDAEGNAVPWEGPYADMKSQFHHAFLILAASAATVANRPGALELLNAALHDQERFWLDKNGLVHDSLTADHKPTDRLHAMDCLLHTAEAYLSAAEATTDPLWIERAEVMAQFVNEQASSHNWRLPEYYDAQWKPLDHVPSGFDDGRRVYTGYVIGHSMQWARLAVHIRAALRSMGRQQPDYLFEMAQELFHRARVDGWRRNGKPGFALTVSADGEPVDTHHLQWVVCEGVCAALAIRRAMLDDGVNPAEVESYEHCHRSWLDFINDYLILSPGRWIRALDENNEPASEPIASRLDVYHAIQTLLMSRVPLWPPFASAISRGLLDHPEEAPTDRRSWNIFKHRW